MRQEHLILPSIAGLGARAHLFGDLPDDTAGIAGREDARGDIARDHAAGADDRARADPNSRAEDRRTADPHVRADLDRPAELLDSPQLRAPRVQGGVDLHGRAEEGVIPDLHIAYIQYDAVEVEVDPRPEPDVRAVVAEER